MLWFSYGDGGSGGGRGEERKQSEVLPNRTHPPHIDIDSESGESYKSEFRGGPGAAEANVL